MEMEKERKIDKMVEKELDEKLESLGLKLSKDGRFVLDGYGKEIYKDSLVCEECGSIDFVLGRDVSGKWNGWVSCGACSKKSEEMNAKDFAKKIIGREMKVKIERLKDKITEEEEKFKIMVEEIKFRNEEKIKYQINCLDGKHDIKMRYLSDKLERLKNGLDDENDEDVAE